MESDAGTGAASNPSSPPLPPPLPAATPPPLPASVTHPAAADNDPLQIVLQGRLHPTTLLFAAWSAFRNVIIPLVVVLFFGRKGGHDTFVIIALLFLVLPLGYAVVRYFTFTYRIQNGDLITAHGVIGRTQRHIPLTRVQDIRLEQRLLHRLFGVAEVHVETAGGQGAEASLSVLSKTEAERLRTAVFEHAGRVVSSPGAAAPPPQELIRQLTLRDLLLAGITSNQMASAMAILFVAWNLVDDVISENAYEQFIRRATTSAADWMQQTGRPEWLIFILGAFAVLAVGMAFSVVGSVLMFYGFTLARRGEDLHRSYGLLTRRASSLPRRRIQVLKVEETLLRRAFRLATLRADSAGSKASQGQEGSGGRDVLLPIVPRTDVDSLLPSFFPDLDPGAGDWRKVSRRAIRRGTMKGSLVCVIAAALSFFVQWSWPALWPLGFIPLVYVLNVMSYRRLGYCLHGNYFRTRRGWLRRSTHIVPVRNVQAVVLRQTPLDRWHGVITLMVDTAGQAYTGGGPRIGNVPLQDAALVARDLARQAARTRYSW